MVGTSGTWSVVETTQSARHGADGGGAGVGGGQGVARRGLRSPWLLVAAGAATAATVLFALRAQSARRRPHTVETVER